MISNSPHGDRIALTEIFQKKYLLDYMEIPVLEQIKFRFEPIEICSGTSAISEPEVASDFASKTVSMEPKTHSDAKKLPIFFLVLQ